MMKEYFELFFSFCYIGLFMFGGGYAMLPLLEHVIVDKKKWLTHEEILDLYALAQCTPGVVAVNTATKTGYKIKGTIGALFATVGVIVPSFIIIVIISMVLKSFSEIEQVSSMLTGIRIAACAMIINTLIKLMKAGIKGWIGVLVFAAAVVLALILKVQPVWIVLMGIFVGIASEKFRKKEDKK